MHSQPQRGTPLPFLTAILAVALATMSLVRSERSPAAPPNAPRDWTPTLGAMERRLADLERRLGENAAKAATALPPREPAAAKAIADLVAWRQLRRLGTDAWTDPVVDEMVRIGLGAADADTRADVWRQAHGRSRSGRIVPGLLRALANDPADKAREEAAETLADYRDDLSVRMALEHAAEHDVAENVRRQARNALHDR